MLCNRFNKTFTRCYNTLPMFSPRSMKPSCKSGGNPSISNDSLSALRPVNNTIETVIKTQDMAIFM